MAAAACGPRLTPFLLTLIALQTVFISTYARTLPTSLRDDDFVIALSSATSRLTMAQGTRAYRMGIRTLIMTDNETMVPHLNKVYAKYREVYEYFPDETKASKKWHAKNPGDFRAAMAPFAAHRHFGNTYKWLLYGDDDTVFCMPGVRQLVAHFDPKVPLALTDNLWHGPSHPSLQAFRCLPCGFDTRRLAPLQNYTGYMPRPACPYCTPAAACPPTNPDCSIAGAHGGAGMIFSAALMRKLTYDKAHECMSSIFMCSGGDALVSQCLWRAGYGFTDPGWSLMQPSPLEHVLFDSLSSRWLLRNPIDALVMGNCGADCASILRHAVSFHLRGKSYPNFPKAAAAMFGLVESHAAALEFLELREDWASRAEPPGVEGEL